MPKSKKLSWLPVYKAAFQNVRLSFWPLVGMGFLFFLLVVLISSPLVFWFFSKFKDFKSLESYTPGTLLPLFSDFRLILLATVVFILATALMAAWEGALYRTFLEGARKGNKFSGKNFFAAAGRFFFPIFKLEFFVFVLFLVTYFLPAYFLFHLVGKDFFFSGGVLSITATHFFGVIYFIIIQIPACLMVSGIVEGKSLKLSWLAMKEKIKKQRWWILKGMALAYLIYTGLKLAMELLTPDLLEKNIENVGAIILLAAITFFISLLTVLVSSLVYFLYFPALAVQFWISKEVKGG